MALSIKRKDWPFVVIDGKVRYPNGHEEPLKGDTLGLVQVFLLNEVLAELKKANETPEPPPQQITKAK